MSEAPTSDTMSPEALEALRGSIRKWEGIIAGTESDRGERNCPLCQQFPASRCDGCPVKERTGKGNCFGTPYHGEWMRLSAPDVRGCGCGSCKGERVALTDRAREAAKAELDFLKSLLPPGVTS